MVTITDSTLRQNVFETIYDLLVSTIATSTATIYAGYPDFNTDKNSKVFPFVVLQPVSVGSVEFSNDRTTSSKNVSVIIELYTKKNKDLDILSDLINTALSTNISGLQLQEVSEDYGIIFPNDDKVKQKTLTIMFLRR